MEIEIEQLVSLPERSMTRVTLTASFDRGEVIDNVTFDVFVEAKDSIAETHRLAVEKLHSIAREIVDAPPPTHVYTGL